MSIINNIDEKLNSLYGRIKQNKKAEIITGILIYTVIFCIISLGTHVKIIKNTGTILGGDGVAQYYPLLVDFRRNVCDFFRSIAEGHPSLRMMNFNFMFGSDTYTTSTMSFLPMLPVYMLSALVPEKSLALFFACVIIFMSYISGITNIIMCRHFKADFIWSCIFASAYVFCGNYFYTILWNHSFFYMFILFPLMVTGLDKILNDRSCTLFCISNAILASTGPIGMIYTFPFLVLFAAARVYFIKKEKYFSRLIKYFFKSVGFTLLSVGIAALGFLPYIYVFMNSARSPGETENLLHFLIPSKDYLSDILYQSSEDQSVGINIITIPFLIFCAVSPDTEKEHKFSTLTVPAILSLPLMWYGLNGFMYDLCRWGFVPSCLYTFTAAFYAPKLFKASRQTMILILVYMAAYMLAFPFGLGFVWLAVLMIHAFFTVSPKLRQNVSARTAKYRNNNKSEKPKFKYAMAAAIIIIAITMITVIIFASFFKISLHSIEILIIMLVITAPLVFMKKRIPQALTGVLCICVLSVFFIINIFSYITPSTPSQNVSTNPFLKTFQTFTFNDNSFDRFAEIKDESERFIFNASFDNPHEGNIIIDADSTESHIIQADLPLLYNFASNDIFFSIIDNDFINFLKRCGMDHTSVPATVETHGYDNKEVIYSLLGIKHLYSEYENIPLYGTSPDYSFDNSGNNFFINNYSLPAGVTYDTLIDSEKFYSLNSAELPYAMMNTVYLQDYEGSADNILNDEVYSQKCSYSITKTFNKTSLMDIDCYDTKITLDNEFSNGFFYLCFSGVKFRSTPGTLSGLLKINIDNKNLFTYKIGNNASSWPWKFKKDFYALPLGFCDEPVHELSFLATMEYDNLDIYFIPEEVYTNGYDRICSETLENVETGINTVTGNINVSSDKVLCVNLLHNDGWKAYVDGVEAPVYKANELFLGIPLEKGSHDIKLIYRTPWLYEGVVVSVVSLIILIYISSRKKSESSVRKQK